MPDGRLKFGDSIVNAAPRGKAKPILQPCRQLGMDRDKNLWRRPVGNDVRVWRMGKQPDLEIDFLGYGSRWRE